MTMINLLYRMGSAIYSIYCFSLKTEFLLLTFLIDFNTGGEAYSTGTFNPWPWLTSQSAAEEMAERVAKWPTEYNCDGIDLDLEEGAGARYSKDTAMEAIV